MCWRCALWRSRLTQAGGPKWPFRWLREWGMGMAGASIHGRGTRSPSEILPCADQDLSILTLALFKSKQNPLRISCYPSGGQDRCYVRAVGREGAVCCRHRATVHALDPGRGRGPAFNVRIPSHGPFGPGARGGRFRADLSQFSGRSNKSLNRSGPTHIDETLLSNPYLPNQI